MFNETRSTSQAASRPVHSTDDDASCTATAAAAAAAAALKCCTCSIYCLIRFVEPIKANHAIELKAMASNYRRPTYSHRRLVGSQHRNGGRGGEGWMRVLGGA